MATEPSCRAVTTLSKSRSWFGGADDFMVHLSWRSVRVPQVGKKHEPTLVIERSAIDGLGSEKVACERRHLPPLGLVALPISRCVIDPCLAENNQADVF